MAGLTRYGDFWGRIPETGGRIFWVAPSASYTVGGRAYSAGDGNDGRDPRRAVLTVNRAMALAAADAGDVIVCLPGAHTLSASLAMSKAGITLTGLPSGKGNYLKQKTTINAVTGDQNVNVTAANCEIAYLNFIPVTADTAIDFTDAADGLHIHHCSFDMATPVVNIGTIGIEALGAASNVLIDNCYFESDGAQGAGIVAGAIVDSVIEDCLFMLSAGSWAAALSIAGAGADRDVIRRCSFFCSGTAITVAILGGTLTGANCVFIADCRFSDLCTTPVDTFDTADAELVENYIAGVGATDGGVLVVAIT